MVSTKLEQALATEKLQKYQKNLEKLISEQTAKLEQNNKELRTQNNELEKQLIAHVSEDSIRASWSKAIQGFKKIRKKYLRYSDFE